MYFACTMLYGVICVFATHFLWLSVRVIPWEDTLKWTTVEVGGGLVLRVMLVAFCTAWMPVRDSISTEPRYHTLQAAGRSAQFQITLGSKSLNANKQNPTVHNNRTRKGMYVRVAHKDCVSVRVQCHHWFVIMSINSKWGQTPDYLPLVLAAQRQSWWLSARYSPQHLREDLWTRKASTSLRLLGENHNRHICI